MDKQCAVAKPLSLSLSLSLDTFYKCTHNNTYMPTKTILTVYPASCIISEC